jgi:hypothetical protein
VASVNGPTFVNAYGGGFAAGAAAGAAGFSAAAGASAARAIHAIDAMRAAEPPITFRAHAFMLLGFMTF